MKSKTFLLLTVAALAVAPILSSAQNTDINSSAAEIKSRVRAELEERQESLREKQEQIREEIQIRTEAIKSEMEAKREQVRSEAQERKEAALSQIRERLQNFAQKIIERYEAAVSRLEKLSERIASRIAKFEEAGIDATEAKELLEIADLKIETAAASVAAIGTAEEVIASNTSTTTDAVKADLESLRAEMAQAKSDIKAAHAALIDVIIALKPGQMKLESGQADSEDSENDDNSDNEN